MEGVIELGKLAAEHAAQIATEILRHPCQYCQARPGEPCVTVEGRNPGAETAAHAVRMRTGYAIWLDGAWQKQKAADLKSPPPATVTTAVGGDDPTTPPAEGREDFHVEGCPRPMQYGCWACDCGFHGTVRPSS